MATTIEKTIYTTGETSAKTFKNFIQNLLIDLTTNSTLPCTGWTFDGTNTFTKSDDLQDSIISYVNTIHEMYDGDTDFYLSFHYNYIIQFHIDAAYASPDRKWYLRLRLYKVSISGNVATVINSSDLCAERQIAYIGDNVLNISCHYGILKNDELFIIYINSNDKSQGIGLLYSSHDDLYKIVSVYSADSSLTPVSFNTVWRTHASYSNKSYYDVYDTSYTPYFYKLGDTAGIYFINRTPYAYSLLHENQIQTIKDKKMINSNNSTVSVTLNTVYDSTKVKPNKVIQIDEKTFYTLDYYTLIDISSNA